MYESEAPKQILNRFEKGWPAVVDTGRGWYTLLVVLDRDLAALIPDYTVLQVKEKFGTLRFYVDPFNFDPEVSVDTATEFLRRIDEAATDSARTCEECGAEADPKASSKVGFHYIRTLCTRDAEIYAASRAKMYS